MKTTRPTLEDVAHLAGVSLGSASRALSVPGEVKPQTLERVQWAVEQLGYVRNGAAQALASRRTRMIAAVYPTLNNPIFADSMHHLQRSLWECGYQLLVGSHDYNPAREQEVVRSLVERGIDGLLLVGTDHSPQIFEMLRKHAIPYALMWSLDESNQAHCIGFSNHEAAYRMARLVLRYGHQRIAFCSGNPAGNERVRARIKGTMAALQEAGLDVPPEWRVEQPFTFDGGREAVRHILQYDPAPTVLICGTDLQAIGAIDECRRRGVSVPEQFSVTGFDDIEHAALVEPGLTTIHTPSMEVGVRAAQYIVSLIESKAPAPPPPIESPLIIRSSLRNLLG